MNVNNNKKEKISHSIARKKEKAVIIITLLCFAISGIVLPQIKPSSASTDIETAIVQQHNDSKKEKSKHTKANNTSEKGEREEDTKEEEKKEAAEEETQDDATNAEHKEASDKKAKEQADVQDSTGNASASNSSSSNAGASSSSSSASAPAAPAKEKVWVPPVYQTIHHDAVYDTVKVVVCNYCGAEFGSTGEFQAHKDANGG